MNLVKLPYTGGCTYVVREHIISFRVYPNGTCINLRVDLSNGEALDKSVEWVNKKTRSRLDDRIQEIADEFLQELSNGLDVNDPVSIVDAVLGSEC